MLEWFLHKGDQIDIPNAEIFSSYGNIRQWILNSAHNGHPVIVSMKPSFTPEHGFPNMDKERGKTVPECLPYQASTEKKHKNPLFSTESPIRQWEELNADHSDPTADGKYLLVVIDELNQYNEVAIVSEWRHISYNPSIAALEEIFTRHGFYKVLKTVEGPTFNGKEMQS